MEQMGLLLQKEPGQTYLDRVVPNIPQGDAYPDFSNPRTLDFISESLKDVLREYEMDGWMADFGEWQPVDARPQDGSDPVERRNTFPVEWQRANREALEAVRRNDWAMIARSGFTRVQGVAQIHWVGDQNTDWGRARWTAHGRPGHVESRIGGATVRDARHRRLHAVCGW